MIYERHFEAAEESHRSLVTDVAWDRIDAATALAQPELLRQLRDAAIVESYHPVHIPDVLRAAWDDIDATAILSIELFEGFRHFHGLKRYLDLVGFEPRLMAEELVTVRRTALARPPETTDLTTLLVDFMGSEHFAGYFFVRLGRQAAEPVLRDLLERFSRDEFRHAAGIADVLRQRVERDRALAERVLEAAVGFVHYGTAVVDRVPTAVEHDLAAIVAFDRRVEQVCGRSPRAWVKEALAAGRNAAQRASTGAVDG